MTQAFNLSQLANNLTSSGQLDATDGLVNSVPVANGGTGATTAGAAQTNLNVPSRTGGGASGTWGISITGNAATATTASSLTGTLSVANGGTGATSLTANRVLLGNGTSAIQTVAPGTSGNLLTSNGTTWVSSAPAVVVPESLAVGDIVDMLYATTSAAVGAALYVARNTTIAGTSLRYATGTSNVAIQEFGGFSVTTTSALSSGQAFPTGGSLATPSGTWRVMQYSKYSAGFAGQELFPNDFFWYSLRMIRIS